MRQFKNKLTREYINEDKTEISSSECDCVDDGVWDRFIFQRSTTKFQVNTT